MAPSPAASDQRSEAWNTWELVAGGFHDGSALAPVSFGRPWDVASMHIRTVYRTYIDAGGISWGNLWAGSHDPAWEVLVLAYRHGHLDT